jgi:DNA-binding CsgD family transcriptional regulator
MYRFDQVREADMAALLRIVGEVTELPQDKVVRQTHVLRRTLELIGGRSATAFEMARPNEDGIARPGTIINIDASCDAERRGSELYLVHDAPADPATFELKRAYGQTFTRVRDIEDREYYRTTHFNVVRKPFGIDHSLYCRLVLPDGTDFGTGILRCPGDRVFSEREIAMVQMLHMHAPHIYYVRPPAQSELTRLAPRLQPVMRYLLQGDAEKQVAAKLKLSQHTVHRYTQVIYAELGVHSRAELLAKYARMA